MKSNWFGRTIGRKLLLAFFFVFIITYLVTALVVQSAVRTAVTDSELATLSQLTQLKLSSLDARVKQLATNLSAWTRLDVMNDIISGDVDKRVEHTLENLKKDYGIQGQIYAFNATGHLIASSDPRERQNKTAMLPDKWKPRGQLSFVNKHANPFDGEVIVALTVPVSASFAANYQLGTIVLAYHWSEISAALPEQTLLLFHQHSTAPLDSMTITQAPDVTPSDPGTHQESIVLMESKLGKLVPKESLVELAHLDGWVQVGSAPYLVNSALESTGLLSGWEVVMLREPGPLYQTVHLVILKLAILGLILTLPLILAIRWLAGRLTAPLLS